MNLPYQEYLIYARDSWIAAVEQHEDGRKMLKAIHRLNQTKPDLEAVRAFNKGGAI